jgi:DNA-binding NtrC family response regulator
MESYFNALVIDEDSGVRVCFKKALNRLGCSVKEAESAECGISELASNGFNVVFASLCVKNIGARGVARWIKTHSPKTKFFVITSWKGQLEQHILAVDGIHGVIHKPLLFTEIRDALLEQLG